jgi:hypothetical protein
LLTPAPDITIDGNASQYSSLLFGPVVKANRSALPSANNVMQIINPLSHNGNYVYHLLPSLKKLCILFTQCKSVLILKQMKTYKCQSVFFIGSHRVTLWSSIP